MACPYVTSGQRAGHPHSREQARGNESGVEPPHSKVLRTLSFFAANAFMDILNVHKLAGPDPPVPTPVSRATNH